MGNPSGAFNGQSPMASFQWESATKMGRGLLANVENQVDIQENKSVGYSESEANHEGLGKGSHHAFLVFFAVGFDNELMG